MTLLLTVGALLIGFVPNGSFPCSAKRPSLSCCFQVGEVFEQLLTVSLLLNSWIFV